MSALASLVTSLDVYIANDFLPFGREHGDSVVLGLDDGSSEDIKLATDAIIFGLHQNCLYVSHVYNLMSHICAPLPVLLQVGGCIHVHIYMHACLAN